MRRSSAPSQVNKKRKIFIPPCRKSAEPQPYSSLHKADNQSISPVCLEDTVGQDMGSEITRSKLDLLNIIKSRSVPEFITNDLEYSIICENAHLNNEVISTDTTEISNERNTSLISCSTESPKYDIGADKTRYFSVMWCKLSKKKHKHWEGDAVLIVNGRSVVLKDTEGKEIGRGSGYKLKDLENLEEGNTLPIGTKEVEIHGTVSEENYKSGGCFQGNIVEAEAPVSPVIKSKPKPFCLPIRKADDLTHTKESSMGKSLFYPLSPDALVMPRPTSNHQWLFNNESLPVTDVVVDLRIGDILRPHQQAGVLFLYESIMGYKCKEYQGAILADEMGLGKTLQCIALIWTLLKQGPYGCIPVLKRVLIVTPSSIVANWGKEFDKWLGQERIKPFMVDQQQKVEDFVKQRISPVLIISYEMLLRNIEKINNIHFDLLLCDEGHRLKNVNIKTTSILTSLNIKRRLLLTGTPIQNDLQELFSLVEFVNPGILGSYSKFKRIYEVPIVQAQQPSASQEEKQIGEIRTLELNRITSQFTLRRTQEIINKFLPPKNEYVVFCKPAETQSSLYKSVIRCRSLQHCLLSGEMDETLSVICILRKLCNHPSLLRLYEEKENLSEIQNEILKWLPEELIRSDYMEQHSGKLAVVSCLLWSISETKRERVVVVSNFTTTLDMLQQLCEKYKYTFLRLDGSTPTARRQGLVDRFNRINCPEFVFLLSAKAGGVGINLIGASRIILFDIDWNPATDLQAMSRVWRDGQRKTVYVYRLLLSGSIEEKMYQRQVCKQGISGSVVDGRGASNIKFSKEELRDLFSFNENALCLTHESLKCPCDELGGEVFSTETGTSPTEERDCQIFEERKLPTESLATMDQLHRWQHFSIPKGIGSLQDSHLEVALDFVNYVFKCHSG